MRVLKSTLIAGLISILVPFSSFAEKVKIGDPGWTGATAIANLLAAVVTDKMGGEAELVPGNNTAIYGAIATKFICIHVRKGRSKPRFRKHSF